MSLKDPMCGGDLDEIDESVYRCDSNGNIYVHGKKEELESVEFNQKLKKVYDSKKERNSNEKIYIVLNGELLKDPICGGPINKIGEGLFQSEYSDNIYLMTNDQLLKLAEPIAGTEISLQENGKYYSDTLEKYFTLEKFENGSMGFFPNYLPYEGMTDVEAELIDGQLVGKNGIKFPVGENGYIDLPMKDNLTTQEEIDEDIAEKHRITEIALEKMEKEINEEINSKRALFGEEVQKYDFMIRAIEIATQRECISIEIKTILEEAKISGRNVDMSELPQLPEIPEDIPKDIMENAINKIKAFSPKEQVLSFERNAENTLQFGNVNNVIQGVTNSEIEAVANNLGKSFDMVLENETEKNNPNKNDEER